MKMYKLGCALLVAASASMTAQATPIVSVLNSSTVDLNGNFVYALTMNPNAAGTTVGNANFTYARGGATVGATVSNQNYIQNWHSNTNTAAAGLDAVMKSIIWSGGGDAQVVTLTMANLVIGNTYKAQLMFGEAGYNRGFDIYQNDVKVWDDFSAYGLGGNNGNGLFSNTFIATSSTLKFGLGYNGNRPDWNPILNAATLENVGSTNSVPAPASLGLLLAGFAAVAVARKKRQ